MASLPENVIAEIISRLPIKSVAKFRCVSKLWNSLISNNSHFFLLRFNNSPLKPQINTHKLLILEPCSSQFLSFYYNSSSFGSDNLVPLDFPFKTSDFSEFEIVGSCNGLVCVSLFRYKDLIVWNPSNGFYRHIPNPSDQFDSAYYSYGFGYDHLIDDYKIIVAVEVDNLVPNCMLYVVEVYSFKSNSWKRILDTVDPLDSIVCNAYDDRDRRGVVLNGFLHWKSYNRVYAFDIVNETFSEVLVPDHKIYFESLTTLDECLTLTHFRCGMDVYATDLWMLRTKGSQSSWVMFSTVSVPNIEECHIYLDIFPLCITKGGEIISLNSCESLAKINVKDTTLSSFYIGHQGQWPKCQVIIYVENPISLET